MSDVAAIKIRGFDVDIEAVRVLNVYSQIEVLDVSAINVALYGVSKCLRKTSATNGS